MGYRVNLSRSKDRIENFATTGGQKAKVKITPLRNELQVALLLCAMFFPQMCDTIKVMYGIPKN